MDGLGDFTTPDRLRFLIDHLTENGKNSHLFENFTLLNSSRWILADTFPISIHMRYLGYPSSRPVYLFIVVESNFKFPHLHVRTPSTGHNKELLEDALKAVLDELKTSLTKHGKMILHSDTAVRTAFFKLQQEGAPFETLSSGDFIPFYMDEEQKLAIIEKEFIAPDGYEIGSVDVDKEYGFIHRMWSSAGLSPDAETKQRLDHFPSVCIRDSDGHLASWELTHGLGAVTHLFTLEKHRGKGLGVFTENLLAQKLVKEGLHVYKYVSVTNVDVVRGTDRHPLWSRWRALEDDVKENTQDMENGVGKEVTWSINCFKFTGQ